MSARGVPSTDPIRDNARRRPAKKSLSPGDDPFATVRHHFVTTSPAKNGVSCGVTPAWDLCRVNDTKSVDSRRSDSKTTKYSRTDRRPIRVDGHKQCPRLDIHPPLAAVYRPRAQVSTSVRSPNRHGGRSTTGLCMSS